MGWISRLLKYEHHDAPLRDGSAAARWEKRIHHIVILSGCFRRERLPGTSLKSWDIQFQIAQFLTAASRSCVSGAQSCCCCSWRYFDRHRHQQQEKLRKAHRRQWSGAVFRGGLPPFGRPFLWRRWSPEPGSRMWRSPATSEALQPGVPESPRVRHDSINCVAEAAGCQLDQFKRSKLLTVPRVANLVAMFRQFVETRCFFLEC